MFQDNGTFVIKDLSTNGTSVNMETIGRGKETVMKEGDTISFLTVPAMRSNRITFTLVIPKPPQVTLVHVDDTYVCNCRCV